MFPEFETNLMLVDDIHCTYIYRGSVLLTFPSAYQMNSLLLYLVYQSDLSTARIFERIDLLPKHFSTSSAPLEQCYKGIAR